MQPTAESFYALIDLVNFDHKVRTYNQEIATLRSQIELLERKKDAIQQKYHSCKKEVVERKKEVDTQELTMRELDETERAKKGTLENVADFKEYKSLKSELDHVHSAQHEQEKRVVYAWDQLEAVQERLNTEQPEYEQSINQATQELERVVAKEQELQQELAEYRNHRAAKEKMVPLEWLEKYAIMQARVEDPVVPVEENSCSVCFYQLTGQDGQVVRRGGLAQCKGCYRLLFLQSVMQGGQ